METKKVKVIMLLAKETPRIGDFIIMKVINPPVIDDELQCGIKLNEPQNLEEEYYHLYFLSNEEIKEGDWYITFDNRILQFLNSTHIHEKPLNVKGKIIASTDDLIIEEKEGYNGANISISLPHPTTDFIKAYVKAGGIDEVMVECETLDENRIWTSKEIEEYPKLKVNSYNEITIHPIKDCYSREEVLDFAEKMLEGYKYLLVDDAQPNIREWLSKNLK